MVYVPYEDIEDFSCYTVYDNYTIRAYENDLQVGSNSYTDFYVNSHYLQKNGVENFTTVSEFPSCINVDNLTNDYWYRLDLAHILIIVSFFLVFIYFTFKVFSRIFGRWLKV